MSKTFDDALRDTELPKSEILYILRELTGLNYSEIEFQKNSLLHPELWVEFLEIVEQRKNNKPLQYIFGHSYFYDRDYEVDETVLIPRPETELLVEKIIQDNGNKENLSILDIGTGSGCIAISLALKLPNSHVDAVDIHPMIIAQKNASTHNASVKFFQSDIFSNVTNEYDIVVSNPPYIGEKEYSTLEKQVKNFEPQQALLAEDNGLYFYKKILTDLNRFLTYKGALYLEIGATQAEEIKRFAHRQGYTCQITQDLNGLDRLAKIQLEI